MIPDGYRVYAPTGFGGSPVALHLYAEDVGADCAVAADGPLKRRVPDMFYGGRAGSFIDPFGHVWHVATHIEEVPPCEINRRVAAAMGQGTDP